MPIMRTDQPAAPHAAAHRSKPRHRPRHGEALLRRRLARDHLLAPSVPGELSVGRRTGGSHPGRSRRSRTTRSTAIAEIKRRLDSGELHALVNNAAISPKAEGGKRLGSLDTANEVLAAGVPGEFLRADHAGARTGRRAEGRQGLGGERDLDRRLARASVRRRGLRHLEGGARLAHARDGVATSAGSASASTPSRRARSTPRSCRPAPTRSSSRFRCSGSARPTRWRRSSTCCARRRSPT